MAEEEVLGSRQAKGGEELGLGIQRSMIFERWIPGSSSRMRVVQ